MEPTLADLENQDPVVDETPTPISDAQDEVADLDLQIDHLREKKRLLEEQEEALLLRREQIKSHFPVHPVIIFNSETEPTYPDEEDPI